jgi:hypothetical protein
MQICRHPTVARSPHPPTSSKVPWRPFSRRDRHLAEGRHRWTATASRRASTSTDRRRQQRQHHDDGHRPSITAAKCPRVINGSLTGSEHHADTGVACVRKKPSPLLPGDGFLSCRYEMRNTARIEPGASMGDGSHRHPSSSPPRRGRRQQQQQHRQPIATASRHRIAATSGHAQLSSARYASEFGLSAAAPARLSAGGYAPPSTPTKFGDLIGNGTVVPMRHCGEKTSPPDAS